MEPPTQADIDALRAELEEVILHGSDARRKAVAQAFVHRIVVEAREVIRPSFYVRGSLPSELAGDPGETGPGGRSRAETPSVGATSREAMPISVLLTR